MGILTDSVIKTHNAFLTHFGIIVTRPPKKKYEIVNNDTFVAQNHKKSVDKLLILWYS